MAAIGSPAPGILEKWRDQFVTRQYSLGIARAEALTIAVPSISHK